MKCSICQGIIKTKETHNAEPVNDGRCCRQCNVHVVLPARIQAIQLGDKNE